MDDVVTVTAHRRFARTFVIAVQLWFGTASGYFSVLVLAAVMTAIFFDARSPWLTGAAGAAWVLLMIPLVLAMQAWKLTRWARAHGRPVFSFDAGGATCRTGDMTSRIAWSGVKRIRLTGKTCFVYVTPRAAWFFGRDEISPHDEGVLLDFARQAGVALAGKGRA